ncbi:MAG: hypothetical protein U1F65_09395 [Verrucomicrobiota bacterium]
MKKPFLILFLVATVQTAKAATTINSANKFSYGANIGWIDWRGDATNGARIGQYVCSGYIYGANVGWINLGGGAPTNGIFYQNVSANDFGVNNDGLGNLRGYAYGANIGWINFENTSAPRLDLKTGRLTGFVFSANCGWISLSNAFAFVQTDTIAPAADTDGDGIADAWEYQKFGNLTAANAGSNADGDPATDLQEYLADTNPNNASSHLRITAYATAPTGVTNLLTWTSELTRNYRVEATLSLNPPAVWYGSGLGLVFPDGTFTTRNVTDTNSPMRFHRIRAVIPLSP